MASVVVALILVAVIAYAWIDGGRRPLRPIVTPVQPALPAAGASR